MDERPGQSLGPYLAEVLREAEGQDDHPGENRAALRPPCLASHLSQVRQKENALPPRSLALMQLIHGENNRPDAREQRISASTSSILIIGDSFFFLDLFKISIYSFPSQEFCDNSIFSCGSYQIHMRSRGT